jgi:hypothetical protein
MNFGKKHSIRAYRSKPFDHSVANSILYNYGGCSLHVLSFKALTHVICTKKNIIFTSLPFKIHLTNSVANSILYNYGGSSLHVLSFKALTQVIFPGDLRVAWSFIYTAICSFSILISEKKHQFHELTVHTNLTISITNLILYNYGRSSLHI